jgi:hypothetical protein
MFPTSKIYPLEPHLLSRLHWFFADTLLACMVSGLETTCNFAGYNSEYCCNEPLEITIAATLSLLTIHPWADLPGTRRYKRTSYKSLRHNRNNEFLLSNWTPNSDVSRIRELVPLRLFHGLPNVACKLCFCLSASTGIRNSSTCWIRATSGVNRHCHAWGDQELDGDMNAGVREKLAHAHYPSLCCPMPLSQWPGRLNSPVKWYSTHECQSESCGELLISHCFIQISYTINSQNLEKKSILIDPKMIHRKIWRIYMNLTIYSTLLLIGFQCLVSSDDNCHIKMAAPLTGCTEEWRSVTSLMRFLSAPREQIREFNKSTTGNKLACMNPLKTFLSTAQTLLANDGSLKCTRSLLK